MPSRLDLYNTPKSSLQRVKTPHPISVLIMTLNNLMVRLQIWSLTIWSLEPLWGTLSLPLVPGPLWPSMVALERILSMGQIELIDI